MQGYFAPRIERLIKQVAVGAAVFLSILLASKDADADLIELRALHINYENYAWLNSNARDPVIWPDKPKEGLGVGIDTTLLSFGYWDSIVHATTDSGQYRAVGLDTRIGVRITPTVELGLHHHSQHLLDRAHSSMPKFPVTDSVQLRFYLFRAKGRPDGIF